MSKWGKGAQVSLNKEIDAQVRATFLAAEVGVLREPVKLVGECQADPAEIMAALHSVTNAFAWGRTPQGFDYWQGVVDNLKGLLKETSSPTTSIGGINER